MAHGWDRLSFFGKPARLTDQDAFATYLASVCKIDWVVYAKPPFCKPEITGAIARPRFKPNGPHSNGERPVLAQATVAKAIGSTPVPHNLFARGMDFP